MKVLVMLVHNTPVIVNAHILQFLDQPISVLVLNDFEVPDLRFMGPICDFFELRSLGQRLSESCVLQWLTSLGKWDSWFLQLARAWATVDDATVLRAELESWSPDEMAGHLNITLNKAA